MMESSSQQPMRSMGLTSTARRQIPCNTAGLKGSNRRLFEPNTCSTRQQAAVSLGGARSV